MSRPARGSNAAILSVLAVIAGALVHPALRHLKQPSLQTALALAVAIRSQSRLMEIVVSGDWGYFWSTYSLVATPKDGDAPIKSKGKSLFIVKWQRRGAWRIARLIDNSDQPGCAGETRRQRLSSRNVPAQALACGALQHIPIERSIMSDHSCTHCKLRAKYDCDPRSILGRLWHWHIRFCPGWKAYLKSLPPEARLELRHKYSLPGA